MADNVVVKVEDYGYIRGQDGASAYEQAVAGGYTGTEEQFAQDLINFAPLAAQAAASATAAQTAQGLAETAQGAAEAAQSAAQGYAGSASDSALLAAQFENNASGYAGRANAYAGDAEYSASVASSERSEAEAAEAEATRQAGIAETQASAAATSAGAASTSATDAAASAVNAAASATAAGNAQTAAEAAQGLAETAQAAAETAQGLAETAAESVSDSAEQISQNAADISDLKSTTNKSINELSGCERIEVQKGSGYKTTGTNIDVTQPATNAQLGCGYLACQPGDKFTYYGRASNSYRPYVFLASNGDIISGSLAPNYSNATKVILTAPENSAYFAFNFNVLLANSNTFYAYKGEFVEKQNKLTFDSAPTEGSTNPVTSDGVATAYNALADEIAEVAENLGFSKLAVQENSRYNTSGTQIDYENPGSTSAADSAWSDCSEGDIFLYSGTGSTNYRSWAFLDSENAIIGELPAVGTYKNQILIAPANAEHVIFNLVDSGFSFPSVYKGINVGFNPFKGLTYSVMGDSMSAFYSDIPEGNVPYYKQSNADAVGLHSSAEMWYSVLGTILGMSKSVINAWSGSCVASGVREPTSSNTFLPGSSPERCNNLGSNPNVIFLAIGTNDYSYDSNAAQFGTWDGATALGTDHDTLADYDTSTFRSAYATMIARVRKNYPNAKLFCLTPWFTKRYSESTGVTYLNKIGKTYTEYGTAISEIANTMGCQVIDASNVGFNKYNYYPTYAQDAAGKTTHMNANGHLVMGVAIARQLLGSFNGGTGSSSGVDSTLSVAGKAADAKAVGDTLDELQITKAPVIIDTASGAIASFEDGADGMPLKSLMVNVEPAQDLHGQSSPYPAGGGKNKLSVASLTLGGTESRTKQVEIDAIPAGTYVLTGTNTGTETSIANYGLQFFDAATGGSNVGQATIGSTFTLTGEAKSIYFYMSSDSYSDGKTVILSDMMIRLSSVSDATFAPYSNICPISGWTGANVTRTGKNLIPISTAIMPGVSYLDGYYNVSFLTGSGAGEKTLFGKWGIANFVSLGLPEGVLIWNYTAIPVNGGAICTANIRVSPHGTEPMEQWYPNTPRVINADDTFFVLLYFASPNTQYNCKVGIQIELGSTATAYEPYQGNTYPISWQTEAGTVYGGTLDVTSGVLTVDRANVLLDGTQSIVLADWRATETSTAWQYAANAFNIKKVDRDKIANILSDKLKSVSYDQNYGQSIDSGISVNPNASYSLIVRVADPSLTTVSAINTFLAANPIQVCYELADPITYQLTPQEITTLLGANNIWADCGDVTVDYPADTKLFIQKVNKPTDDDMTADAQIASGKYFLIGNTLYLSTTTIPAGDTIIPGTNCQKTDLAAALNALNA